MQGAHGYATWHVRTAYRESNQPFNFTVISGGAQTYPNELFAHFHNEAVLVYGPAEPFVFGNSAVLGVSAHLSATGNVALATLNVTVSEIIIRGPNGVGLSKDAYRIEDPNDTPGTQFTPAEDTPDAVIVPAPMPGGLKVSYIGELEESVDMLNWTPVMVPTPGIYDFIPGLQTRHRFLRARPVETETPLKLSNYWSMNDGTGSDMVANHAPMGGGGCAIAFPDPNGLVLMPGSAPRTGVAVLNSAANATPPVTQCLMAGTLPVMTLQDDFTWAFWAKADTAGGDTVIMGNRYNGIGNTEFTPREFVKFTNRQFEWHWNGAGQNIDYDDIPVGQWIHHAVVKQGTLLAYYRNGTPAGSVTITGAPTNPQPLFLGGNGQHENWQGSLDDVATWNSALTPAAIALLASDSANPDTLD
jgi:hypothetical protein